MKKHPLKKTSDLQRDPDIMILDEYGGVVSWGILVQGNVKNRPTWVGVRPA